VAPGRPSPANSASIARSMRSAVGPSPAARSRATSTTSGAVARWRAAGRASAIGGSAEWSSRLREGGAGPKAEMSCEGHRCGSWAADECGVRSQAGQAARPPASSGCGARSHFPPLRTSTGRLYAIRRRARSRESILGICMPTAPTTFALSDILKWMGARLRPGPDSAGAFRGERRSTMPARPRSATWITPATRRR
jgi:hypothetical protein